MPDLIRVAHVVGSLTKGGAERQVIELLNHMNSKEFDRHLIVLRERGDNFGYLLNNEVKSFNLKYRARFFFSGMTRFVSYLKKNRIQILHAHIYDPSKLSALAGIVAGVPVIMTTEHGKNLWKKWYHHLIERVLINRAAAKRIAVSEDIRQIRINYDGTKPENILMIPNGTIIPEYMADTSHNPKIIGTLGRLVEPKDYPTLIEAIRLVREKGWDVELQIAGQGPEKPVLEEFIMRSGMGSHACLVGFQNSSDFLKRIDLFSMSSVREGLPLALLEAMACGLPVAATRVGGIPEVVADGISGLLSEPRDPRGLAENIVKFLRNPELRATLGRNARKTIEESYSIQKLARSYETLYRNALKVGQCSAS
jgi:glycosyltransferase involved in cell wall biosynthesis